MVDKLKIAYATGLLLVGQSAHCDSFEMKREPLRLNLAFVKSQPLSQDERKSLEQGDRVRKDLDDKTGGEVDLLPTIGGHSTIREALAVNGERALATSDHLVWKSIDAEDQNIEKFRTLAPKCGGVGDVVETRADAWEVAYNCMRTLAVEESLRLRLLGERGDTRLEVVEPVLDLVDEGRVEKEAFFSDSEKVGGAESKSFQYRKPSPVWPSGDPGWHRAADYSQLAAAYDVVYSDAKSTSGSKAPRGNVLVAHLDTGYYPDDPLLPDHFDRGLSRTCEKDNCGGDGTGKKSGHGAATLSNLAGKKYPNGDAESMMGGNPSARVFSINIHDSVVHFDSRRMAKGIEAAVASEADVITLSHGGLPSHRLATAVNKAYESGTAIFAATGDYFVTPLWLATTFQQVGYPARYGRVMGVAGVTKDKRSYGQDPNWWSFVWWFSFGPDYFSRLGSWMLRGNFGPTEVMGDNVLSAYSPNITRSAGSGVIRSDGAGTSHSTPQVAAAASLWLEQNRKALTDAKKWRSWEKTEAVYQALAQSAEQCFADYNVEHYGRGILQAKNSLAWKVTETSVQGTNVLALNGPKGEPVALATREKADLDLRGVGALLASAQLPTDVSEPIREAFLNALRTELAQLVFTSDKLQAFLKKFRLCEPSNGCERCRLDDIKGADKLDFAKRIQDLDASKTLKDFVMNAASSKI